MTRAINNYFETKDYSKFKKIRGNRPVDQTHVNALKKLIADKDLKDPIRVNKKNEVIDGQHTLQARKELGLVIPYIVIDSDDPLDVARLNTGRKNWSMDHYLEHHCARGKMDYKICRVKMDAYGLPVAEAMVLLLKLNSKWRRSTDEFKLGDFKIPAGGIANCDRIGSELMQLKKYFNGTDNSKRRIKRQVISAYIIADKHPKWDHNRFKTACKTKSSWLLAGTSARDYLGIFQRIFNAGLTPKKKINLLDFFDSKEYLEY
tara:strand:- start:4856 stop:5638 length:783 start_codon:yes stop_codon:yes gene_type:complete